MNNLKTELATTDPGDVREDSTLCTKMTTDLAGVNVMLNEGHVNYNTTKALEVIKQITNENVRDLICSEQEVTSLTRELDAAMEKASLVVKMETETADSVSEALAKLCPASTTPASTRTGGNRYIFKITEITERVLNDEILKS